MRIAALRSLAAISLGACALVTFLLVTGALAAPAGLPPLLNPDSAIVLAAKFECKMVGGKLVCGSDLNKETGGGAGNAGGEKKKKKTDKNQEGNICAGKKVSCPAGYVVLDKPNKYGACCEPKEGFPRRKQRNVNSPVRSGPHRIAVARPARNSRAIKVASR